MAHRISSYFVDLDRNPGKAYVEATITESAELKAGGEVDRGSMQVRFNTDNLDVARGRASAEAAIKAECAKDERFVGKTIVVR